MLYSSFASPTFAQNFSGTGILLNQMQDKKQVQVHYKLINKGPDAGAQRMLILNALGNRYHYSATETLYAVVVPTLPGLSVRTTSSTLNTQVDKWLVDRVPVHEGGMHYKPCARGYHHRYFRNHGFSGAAAACSAAPGKEEHF